MGEQKALPIQNIKEDYLLEIKNLGPIFTDREMQEILGNGFRVVKLTKTLTPEGYRVRHYPYSKTITDSCRDESPCEAAPSSLDKIKESFANCIKLELEKSGHNNGVIYFAPANKFSTINKEAQLGYLFQYGEEVEAEINFTIKEYIDMAPENYETFTHRGELNKASDMRQATLTKIIAKLNRAIDEHDLVSIETLSKAYQRIASFN